MNASICEPESAHNTILSDVELPQILQDIIIVCITSPLSLAGCIINVINIIIFLKMDRGQTINISLLALSISDATALLGTFWATICLNPWMKNSKHVPFLPREIHLATGSWMHNTFVRISACITFLISAERCICILWPMRIKALVTTRKIKGIIITTFLWGVASQCPYFYTTRFVWKYSEERNASLLGLTYIRNRDDIELPMYVLTNIVIQWIIFFGDVIFTAVLIFKLKQQSKWRILMGQTAAFEATQKRDARVTGLVSAISAIFIVCYFPNTVNFACLVTVPGYNLFERYEHILVLVSTLTFSLEAFNSSINIFVYYKFSSQYRAEFQHLFRSSTSTGSA
ncbi:uncharacterized protein LOC101863248 [Aplysia californica]|uniref:Uncharacterized protein LOC101863248 n=1 Tax=Aplysia californica TaxID=6500 RepID=A0ABM0JHS5_APLCA|nr:uncharacterized protein LOC101863248 [Aplysia californica]